MEPVSVQIRFNAQIVSVQGFGTALLLAQHGVFDGIRDYTGPDAVSADFNTYQGADIRRIAAAYFSQVPRPEKLKIANLLVPPTQWRTWTGALTIPTLPSIGDKVSISVTNPVTGAVSVVEHVVAITEDIPALLTGLTASLDGLPFLTATLTGSTIAITGDSTLCPGARIVCQNPHNVSVLDTEATLPTLAARLSALAGISGDWYHVLTDTTSQANIAAVAAWTETHEKQYNAVTQDSRETSASVLYTALRAANYRRTYLWFHPSGDRIDAALSGAVLPRGWDNGTAPTWAFLAFAGVSTYSLTPTEETYLQGLNANTYTVSHNLSLSWEGKSPSGVYGDLILFVDWLSSRIREAVLRLLANAPNGRIAFTDAGIASVKNAVYAVLVLGRTRGGFSPDEDLTVSAPRAADVPGTDRDNRFLGGGGIGFRGTFAGAIHRVGVNGLVL